MRQPFRSAAKPKNRTPALVFSTWLENLGFAFGTYEKKEKLLNLLWHITCNLPHPQQPSDKRPREELEP